MIEVAPGRDYAVAYLRALAALYTANEIDPARMMARLRNGDPAAYAAMQGRMKGDGFVPEEGKGPFAVGLILAAAADAIERGAPPPPAPVRHPAT